MLSTVGAETATYTIYINRVGWFYSSTLNVEFIVFTVLILNFDLYIYK